MSEWNIFHDTSFISMFLFQNDLKRTRYPPITQLTIGAFTFLVLWRHALAWQRYTCQSDYSLNVSKDAKLTTGRVSTNEHDRVLQFGIHSLAYVNAVYKSHCSQFAFEIAVDIACRCKLTKKTAASKMYKMQFDILNLLSVPARLIVQCTGVPSW